MLPQVDRTIPSSRLTASELSRQPPDNAGGKGETRAPSILMAFRFFKSLKQWKRLDEHSCSHVQIADEIYFKKYRNTEQDARVVKLEKTLTVKL